MGKKKKSKNVNVSLLALTESPQEAAQERKEEVSRYNYPGILTQRLDERTIPFIDSDLKEKDLKNPSHDVVQQWYKKLHVGEYVHMEQARSIDGTVYTTKRVQFEFSRMLEEYSGNMDERGVNPVIERLSFAKMSKISFINNIANPLRYINYFIEYFDDDDELLQAYLSIMFQIDKDDIRLEPKQFIESVYAYFTTDSMIWKLYRLVEHNTDPRLVKQADRVFDESIQLTIEHLKAIMGISCLHKFVIPLVSHYYNTRQNLLEQAKMSDKDLYYSVFMSFIGIFDEIYDIRLHNKLYHTSNTRITKTANQESGMWDRRERVGQTKVVYNNELMRDFVIDISQKAIFAKSAIVFIHVCMDKAIHNTLIQADKHDYVDMTTEPSDSVNETISRFDRMQQDRSHHSEKDRITPKVVNRDMIQRLGLMFGIDFEKMRSKRPKDIRKTKKYRKEFEFYRENIARPFNNTQMYLIKNWYAFQVGNNSDGESMEFEDIIRVIMIMKRDLRARGFNYLPLFISSSIDVAVGKKYNRRKIEQMMKTHGSYEDLMEMYKHTEQIINWDKIINEAKVIIACPIVTLDYEYPELDHKQMTPYDLSTMDEIMRFHLML